MATTLQLSKAAAEGEHFALRRIEKDLFGIGGSVVGHRRRQRESVASQSTVRHCCVCARRAATAMVALSVGSGGRGPGGYY